LPAIRFPSTSTCGVVEQVCHIENYKKVVYQAEGRLLTAEEAAMEWIGKYPGPEGMQ
jgi:hypothetical protein